MREIVKKALELAKNKSKGDAEVYFQHTKRARVFFEKNELKTLHEDEMNGIGVRVVKDGKLGFGASNTIEEDDLAVLIDDAVRAMEKSQADPGNVLPDPSDIKDIPGLYSKELGEYNLPKVLELGKLLFETVKKIDSRITIDSAQVQLTVTDSRLVNSRGISATKSKSSLSYVIMGMAIDGNDISSFDYRYGMILNPEEIESKLQEAAQSFANSVLGSLGAKPCNSFKGLALLSPSTVERLIIMPLSFLLSGENILENRSPFKEKIGEKIAGENLTIYDDPTIPYNPYSTPFDREGVPTKRLTLIENGVLKTFIHNAYSATLLKAPMTGHATGDYSSLPEISIYNAVVEGEIPLDDIYKMIDKGVYVNRFSGNINPVNGLFSGAVKGGWYLENGNRIHPVTGTLISGNALELLNHIVAVSREREQTTMGELPYILVDTVSFTGKQ